MRKLGWFVLILFIFVVPLVSHSNSSTTYLDSTADVGIVRSHTIADICLPDKHPPIANGSAWADYDNDGDVDVFITGMGEVDRLYRNDGVSNLTNLPSYTNMASIYGVDGSTDVSLGATFIDYDNDGDQDLFVTKWGGNSLYHNLLIEDGVVSFSDITDPAGVRDGGRAITAAWGDYDQDGFLDLYLAKHRYCRGDERQADRLYRNQGDGTFEDATHLFCDGLSECPATMSLGFTAGWLDYDNDNDLDLYLINDDIGGAYYPNVLWRNDGLGEDGEWQFVDAAPEAGVDYSLSGMGLAVGDYDNDGWLDMAFSDIGPVVLVRGSGDGTFEDISVPSNVRAITEDMVGWGTAFMDYDNDQHLDLYVVNGKINSPDSMPNIFMANNGDGTFYDFSVGSGLDNPGRARAANLNDFNADGFIDVFVGNYGQPPFLYSHSGEGVYQNSLVVTVEGTTSNRDGIGTRIYLETDVTQMREINSGPTYGGGDERIAHFGMADNTSGYLSIRWPDGTIQNVGYVEPGRLHFVEPVPTAIQLTAITQQIETSPLYTWLFVALSLLSLGVWGLYRIRINS